VSAAGRHDLPTRTGRHDCRPGAGAGCRMPAA